MMRSNESASGMPWLTPELPEWTESLMDAGFSDKAKESLDGGGTYGGRVYVSEETMVKLIVKSVVDWRSKR